MVVLALSDYFSKGNTHDVHWTRQMFVDLCGIGYEQNIENIEHQVFVDLYAAIQIMQANKHS